LRELQTALPTRSLQQVGQIDFTGFKDILKPALPKLSQRPRIVVLFDEIEPIIVCDWGHGFCAQWRALLSNTPDLSEYFTAVFAGAQEMAALQHDLGSPLKDVLEWRILHGLDYPDTCRLMQEPIEMQWPSEFLDSTYNQTGGHPMLVQYVMQHVCNQPPEEAGKSLERAIAKFERERSWQFAQWWERYCTPMAQRIYARLPDDGSPLDLTSLTREFGLNEANDAVEILLHVGLISAEDDGFAFRYRGEMFRRWYRVYGALAQSPTHDPEIYIRLARLDSDLADKYLSAWMIYQSDLPNYSGAVGEMRDTLTLLLERVAPDNEVQAEAGFRVESGQSRPTRRQRVRYATRRIYNHDRSREIICDFDLLETDCDQLAQIVVGAYGGASGLTHTTATRERAFRALKQWDNILAQLVPVT